MDHSTVEIRWEEGPPSADIIARVRADIAENLKGMKRPSRLVFHHVQLTDDIDGPGVTMWGKKRMTCFFAEYHLTTKWVTLSEIEDMHDDGRGDPE